MNEYNMREDLTKKQQKLFDKLDDTTLYEGVEDRQGGTFGTDRAMTIKGWVNQALEWMYMDDCLEEDQAFVNYLLKGGQNTIDAIDDFWDVTILKLVKLDNALIDSAIKHWHNVCDLEWGGEDLARGLIDELEDNNGAGCLDIELSDRETIDLTLEQVDYIKAECLKLRPYVNKEGYVYA